MKTYEEYYAIWKDGIGIMNGMKTLDGSIINRTPEEIEEKARETASRSLVEDKIKEKLEKICKENYLNVSQFQLSMIAHIIVGKFESPGYEKNFQDEIDKYSKEVGLDKFIDNMDLSDINIEQITSRRRHLR